MIYCLGNSHASLFTGHEEMVETYPYEHTNLINGIKSYRLYSTLAYHLYDHQMLNILNIINEIKVRPDDYIMLCFGEVDCRWHLGNQAKIQNKLIDDIIKECVDLYFKVFVQIRPNYKLIAIGPHASTTEGHSGDLERPIFGNCRYRNYITKIFNIELKKLCDQNDISFISIFDKMIDNTWMTDMKYFKDYCHLNKYALQLYLHELTENNLYD